VTRRCRLQCRCNKSSLMQEVSDEMSDEVFANVLSGCESTSQSSSAPPSSAPPPPMRPTMPCDATSTARRRSATIASEQRSFPFLTRSDVR